MTGGLDYRTVLLEKISTACWREGKRNGLLFRRILRLVKLSEPTVFMQWLISIFGSFLQA